MDYRVSEWEKEDRLMRARKERYCVNSQASQKVTSIWTEENL